MKAALIFLNGYYDERYLAFYRQEIDFGIKREYPLICADGGIGIFDRLNQGESETRTPDMLIGDLDSIEGRTTDARQTVEKWIGQTDKDWTDGQLAVEFALTEFNSRHIIIYGGLPRIARYETDHFLGNIKLLRFGHYLIKDKSDEYTAEMRDPLQTIHYVMSKLRLHRKNSGLQRVSLIADQDNTIVQQSQNLRWELTSKHIHPDLTNALRNEFVEEADWVEVRLAENAAPVYVIHNWYD